MVGGDFLSDSLTEALFDRTEAQRVETTSKLLRAREAGMSTATVINRNAILFSVFIEEVDDEIESRVSVARTNSLNANAPSYDSGAVSLLARSSVMKELEQLHADMPIPTLDYLQPAE